MSKDETAFPVTNDPVLASSFGMSLRDYFAAAALTGYLARGGNPENCAGWAYNFADAMLAERDKA